LDAFFAKGGTLPADIVAKLREVLGTSTPPEPMAAHAVVIASTGENAAGDVVNERRERGTLRAVKVADTSSDA
jgi:hypothetical protein